MRNLLSIFPSICSDALSYYQRQYPIEIRPNYSYEIDDIGTVSFKVYCDSATGILALVIDDINWSFPTSRFFSSFLV